MSLGSTPAISFSGAGLPQAGALFLNDLGLQLFVERRRLSKDAPAATGWLPTGRWPWSVVAQGRVFAQVIGNRVVLCSPKRGSV